MNDETRQPNEHATTSADPLGIPSPHCDDESPELDGSRLWRGDTGVLALDSRRALLQLVRGPLINAEDHRDLWQALLNDRAIIASRLADLFLQLIIREEDGIAFARNAPTTDSRIPKTVRNQPLTLIDTVMVLMLRRTLMGALEGRVFIGRAEAFDALAQYRPLAKLDEAAFRDRLDRSWNKLTQAGMLQKTDTPDRCEISPVLRLVFGAEEASAVQASFDELLQKTSSHDGSSETGDFEADDADDGGEEE